jgi:hypothetical protein
MKWSDRNDDNQLQTKRHIPRPDQHQTGQADRFGLFADFGGEDYMINYVRHPVIMKVHKINRYGVGAGLAGKVLAIHLNLVSRQSRPQRT